MRVAGAVAAALLAEAPGPVFGVMGDGNMDVWAALERRAPGAMRAAWHEAAALGMADGYGRVSGGLGVATVTCGPGLTHAATPLVAAVRNRSALLLLAGELPAGQRGTAQDLDQPGFAAACGARYARLSGVATLAGELRDACAAARTEPLVLGLPMELMEQEVAAGWFYAPAQDEAPPPTLTDDAVAELLAVLEGAARPVILAGRGAMRAGAREALLALGERLGALLVTTLPAKGFFAGAALDGGVAGGFSSASTAALLGEADLVLAVGATLGDFTTRNGTLFPRAQVIRLGLEGPELRADARVAAEALGALAEARQVWRPGFRDAAARLAAPRPLPPEPGDGIEPRRLMRVLSAALPDRVQVTCGVGHFWGFVVAELALPPKARIAFGYEFGAIAQALPLAVGAALAAPDRPQLLIEGDGSLMQHVQELETAARLRRPLVLLVMNDGGYGAERHKLVAKRLDGALADWASPDFVAIARAFGGEGAVARRVEEVPALLARGFSGAGLFVIDARLSPSTLSDAYLRALRP
jgi:thiamine pyrophosphate-dependent acetolactate synthase large subunit-like protein